MPSGEAVRAWNAFDVLKGIFASSDEGRIPSSTRVVHSAIHKLAQKEEYSEFLGSYVFDRGGPFPYSRELQSDLTNLEMSGHLSSPNPDFVDYEIKPKLRTTFQKYSAPRFANRISKLEKLSQDFLEEVRTLERSHA